MRKIALLLSAWMLSLLGVAQVNIHPSGQYESSVSLLYSNIESTTIDFTLSDFVLSDVIVNGTVYQKLEMGGMVPLQKAGSPDLLQAVVSLVIPDNGVMTAEVESSSYMEYTGINLLPSRGNLYRDVDPSEVPYVQGEAYTTNAFYPGDIATLRDPYIVRDLRGQALLIRPFQYNPVTGTLRVYHQLTLKVTRTAPGGANTLERSGVSNHVVEDFYHLYDRHFLNFGSLGMLYNPVSEDGNMLVISHGNYISDMQEFVDWKNQKGIPCEIVDVATVGSSASAIKTYLTNYYNTHGLTYLLLVGDAAQIPTNSLSSGHSDNAYAYITGNDHYPEFFVGRFSSENTTHVQTQVLRTLMYEMTPDTTGGWLQKSIGIASDEGPGDDNEMDYTHIRNMQTDLTGFTYTTNLEYFEGSQGGNDAPGNPSSSMVQNGVDDGAGIILYTGHGSTTSWGTSGFSNSSVSNLTNYNKWPFIWSVACVNGNFVNNTCFGEAWLRAAKNDYPTGAIAILASTINQSWNPPMDGQDEMVDILVESYPSNIKRTFGGLSMSGCMKMNDTYGSAGDEMTDTWTIFGDPSVQVFTATPDPLSATHQPVAMIGATQFPVNCNVNGARATLSHNGHILGSGLVSGNSVNIAYTSPTAPDTLMLVVTAFNKIPYIAHIPLIVSNAPFVTYHSHGVEDALGNNNQNADFGETVSLDLSLENIGVFPSGQVQVVLRSHDPFIVIIDSTAFFGTIPNGTSTLRNGIFSLEISDSVPNAYQAPMQLIISDSASNQWTTTFSLLCYAPDFVIDTLYFDDRTGGNGNGKFEPGEVAVVTAIVQNAGGAEANHHMGVMVPGSQVITLFSSDTMITGHLPLNTLDTIQFYVRLDTGIAVGTTYFLDFLFMSGHYQVQSTLSDVYQTGDEDFETGNFIKFPWLLTGSSPWTITTMLPYEGTYSARSGSIGNNAYSAMSVDWYAAYPDTISFWLKVSCENGSGSGQKWDFLEFYIDGVAQQWWDGTKPWMKASFPVAMGQHTFTWRYEKDMYATGGSDAAWIDMITFPASGGVVDLKPFVLMDFAHFSDLHGNNNQIINSGETIDISFQLSNIGFRPAGNVSAVVTSADPWVTLNTPASTIGTMPSGHTQQTGNIVQAIISSSAPLDYSIPFVLTLTDDSANTWSYTFWMKTGGSTGIGDVTDLSGTVTAYPNPAGDHLTILLNNHSLASSLRCTFFTPDGKMVRDQVLNTPGDRNILDLNLEGLPKGVLMLRLMDDQKVITKKIIRR